MRIKNLTGKTLSQSLLSLFFWFWWDYSFLVTHHFFIFDVIFSIKVILVKGEPHIHFQTACIKMTQWLWYSSFPPPPPSLLCYSQIFDKTDSVKKNDLNVFSSKKLFHLWRFETAVEKCSLKEIFLKLLENIRDKLENREIT